MDSELVVWLKPTVNFRASIGLLVGPHIEAALVVSHKQLDLQDLELVTLGITLFPIYIFFHP